MHFKEIEHTADLAIEVWGESKEKLFIHAAEALYFLSIGDVTGASGSEYRLRLEADTYNDLLVIFLGELNFHLTQYGRQLWPIEHLKITSDDNRYNLECGAAVTLLDNESRQAIREIKSVTYHKLNITKQADGYNTFIVFDL